MTIQLQLYSPSQLSLSLSSFFLSGKGDSSGSRWIEFSYRDTHPIGTMWVCTTTNKQPVAGCTEPGVYAQHVCTYSHDTAIHGGRPVGICYRIATCTKKLKEGDLESVLYTTGRKEKKGREREKENVTGFECSYTNLVVAIGSSSSYSWELARDCCCCLVHARSLAGQR